MSLGQASRTQALHMERVGGMDDSHRNRNFAVRPREKEANLSCTTQDVEVFSGIGQYMVILDLTNVTKGSEDFAEIQIRQTGVDVADHEAVQKRKETDVIGSDLQGFSD